MFEQFAYNLKHNRKSVMRSVTAWFLFGAIILVFIFWGLQSRMQQGMAQGGSAAIVNDRIISLAQMSEAMERMQHDPQFEQLASLGGDAGRQILQQQALSQLVQAELLRQASEKNHVLTSDREVVDIVTGIPAFQEEGRFHKERYMAYLESVRKTPAEFEEEVRKQQALRRTVDMFRTALGPLPQEKQLLDAASDLKANLDFVAIQTDSVVAADSIAKADIDAYLKDPASLAKVKEDYESRKKDFTVEAGIHARHILIKADKGNAQSEKQALEKIKMIADKTKKEDFAKLAKQYSEDPGSKDKGGDLGFFAHGRMVPAFDQAAFALEVGKISDPVKTDFGYHLIKVEEKRAATTRNFDDAKSEIAARMIAHQRSVKAMETLEAALKAGDGNAVSQFMDSHKLKWTETGAFSAQTDNVPKIGANEDVLQIAFQLTPAKPIADHVVHQGPTAYVVRYKAVPADAKKPKETDANKIDLMAQFMANQRSEDAVKLWLDSLRKNAKISINQTMASGDAGPPPDSD